MRVWVVKIGSYHNWSKNKIVYEGKTKEDCEKWLYENLHDGEHGYVEQVERRQIHGK